MDVSKHVEKAEEALRKKNFDYAIQLLNQVLALQPDHGEAFSALCRAVKQRHERKPTASWLAKLVGAPHLLSSGLARLTKNHTGRARALTKYLKLEPTSPSVCMALGTSLMHAGYWKAAEAVFVALGETGDKTSGAWRAAAHCQTHLKKIDAALDSLEKALKANPRDAEAERMRKNLAADATLQKGRYESARSSRDLVKDKDQARKLEREQRLHRTEDELAEEEQELANAIEENPADGRSRRRLAAIFSDRNEFDKAIQVLEAGRDHDGNLSDLRDQIGDTRVAAIGREIQKVTKRLRMEPDNESLKEDLKALEDEQSRVQIEEYRRRTSERPTELSLWYTLGKALQETGELDDAIGAFQKSVKDPRTRTDSLVRLGSCFHQKGLFDLAEKQFAAALEDTSATSERGKSILYNLGLVAEKADRHKQALDYFMRIYEIDINYRDVAGKIETLKSAS